MSRMGRSETFSAEKDNLINELRRQGITDENVLWAMREVPRHLFLDKEFSQFAYDNRALPISHQQTISQPYIVAYMTQTLMAKGVPDKVLEVGTGSGYQAAVLALLVSNVFTVERVRELHTRARRLLRKLNFQNIHFRCADGTKGWRQYEPFDAIIVTAAAEEIPSLLTEQLAVGGTLIAPVGGSKGQRLLLMERTRHRIRETILQGVKFVPLIT